MKSVNSIALAAALLPALGFFPAHAQEKSRHMEGLETCAKVESSEAITERETEPGQSLGIESVPNLRDVGGYTTADGKQVATGLLYRSNQLHKIPPADMQKIAALGLKTDFDFRTAAERQPRPDELPEGVKEVWLDVLADADDAGPAQLEQLMKDAKTANQVLGGGKAAAEFAASYRQFVTLPSAKKAFRDQSHLEPVRRSADPAGAAVATGRSARVWTMIDNN